uniref:Integrase_H2C2 domain-containing protein n=1 Tax=Strongyloides venezuelensis TaxID=75913 RepID=A0A0K0FPM5_STRVS
MESISIARDKVDEFEKLQRPATSVQMQRSINKYIESSTDASFPRLPKFLADRIGLVTTIMNCLAIDQRIIVSEETAKKAATAHHAAFHPGRTKLYKYLSGRIYCIGLSTICTRVYNNCLQCIEYRRLPPAKCTK